MHSFAHISVTPHSSLGKVKTKRSPPVTTSVGMDFAMFVQPTTSTSCSPSPPIEIDGATPWIGTRLFRDHGIGKKPRWKSSNTNSRDHQKRAEQETSHKVWQKYGATSSQRECGLKFKHAFTQEYPSTKYLCRINSSKKKQLCLHD